MSRPALKKILQALKSIKMSLENLINHLEEEIRVR